MEFGPTHICTQISTPLTLPQSPSTGAQSAANDLCSTEHKEYLLRVLPSETVRIANTSVRVYIALHYIRAIRSEGTYSMRSGINSRRKAAARQRLGMINTRSSAIAEGPRDASYQMKSCQLPRNSAETTYTTSPGQVDGMKLEI